MENDFDFSTFNTKLIQDNSSKDLIADFDQIYIPKPGNHKPGLGKWRSGKDQKALKGLEVGYLAIMDVKEHTRRTRDKMPALRYDIRSRA